MAQRSYPTKAGERVVICEHCEAVYTEDKWMQAGYSCDNCDFGVGRIYVATDEMLDIDYPETIAGRPYTADA